MGETLDAYHTRLRQLATSCQFINIDCENKTMIIQTCRSTKLLRQELQKLDVSFTDLLGMGRAMELAEFQALWLEQTRQSISLETAQDNVLAVNLGEGFENVTAALELFLTVQARYALLGEKYVIHVVNWNTSPSALAPKTHKRSNRADRKCILFTPSPYPRKKVTKQQGYKKTIFTQSMNRRQLSHAKTKIGNN